MFLTRLPRVTGYQGPIPEREPEKRLPHPRKAAGAQITHSQIGEVVTKNNDARAYSFSYSEWVHFKSFNEDLLEGKSGASSRGNSSSNSVY
jgi:hypothetical protein